MKNPPTAETARVSEIFSSLQGEGPHLGERHVFVRFEECHIHCKYCDELGKPASDMDRGAVLRTVKRLDSESGPHTFVSLTGGEPLIYLNFIKPLMKELRAAGFRNYLETDGILHAALSQVIDLCDCIAMDLKPSSVTGERSFIREHEAFLKVAVQKETFMKMVLSREIDEGEFDDLISMAAVTAPGIMLVLQPLSGSAEGIYDISLMDRIEKLQRRALGKLRDVRIMPRLHKLMNVR